MPDKPDLNKLKNKFDFNSILDNLKAMINPAGGTPEVDPEDALGVKIAQASVLLKEMVQHEHEHVKNMNELNNLLNGIYADVEALRNQPSAEQAAESEKAEKVEKVAELVVEKEKKSDVPPKEDGQ